MIGVTEYYFGFTGFSFDSAVLLNVSLMFPAINLHNHKHIHTYTGTLSHSSGLYYKPRSTM